MERESAWSSRESNTAKRAAGSPMPVLYLARGGSMDGAQRQLAYLIDGLDRARFTPVVALDRPGDLADHLARSDAEVHVLAQHPWRTLGGTLFRQIDLRRLEQLGRSRAAQLVHGSDPRRAGYVLSLARRLGVPSVIHVRGPLGARTVAKHRLDRLSAIITIAPRYRQALLEQGIPPERIQVISDSVDLSRFRPDPSARARLLAELGIADRPIVAIVGRLEPFKRILEFLEIVALADAPPARGAIFLVIGEPGPADYMARVRRRVGELRLENRVRFLGRYSDMPAAIASIDLLATLSGGSVMFEAMAAARTVLSIRGDRHFSVHTRHDETAWCVNSNDPTACAGELQRLLSDEALRARLGNAARQWAMERLSAAEMARLTQQVYTGLPPADSHAKM